MTCKDCKYYDNYYGYGQCVGQKFSPKVNETDTCKAFTPKLNLIDRIKYMGKHSTSYNNGTEITVGRNQTIIDGISKENFDEIMTMVIKELKRDESY